MVLLTEAVTSEPAVGDVQLADGSTRGEPAPTTSASSLRNGGLPLLMMRPSLVFGR